MTIPRKQFFCRRFLVSGADLDTADNLRLSIITKYYTDMRPSKHWDHFFMQDVPQGLRANIHDDRTYIVINHRQMGDLEDYFYTVESKFLEGPATLSSKPLDKAYAEEVLEKTKHKTITKRSFAFQFSRSDYVLDVYPDKYGGDAILSTGTRNGKQLVALPSFTLIQEEVTTNTKYYESNRAK